MRVSAKEKVERELRGRVEHANGVWERVKGSRDRGEDVRYMEVYMAMDGCNRAEYAYIEKMGVMYG
jgi:hypothetical protein